MCRILSKFIEINWNKNKLLKIKLKELLNFKEENNFLIQEGYFSFGNGLFLSFFLHLNKFNLSKSNLSKFTGCG